MTLRNSNYSEEALVERPAMNLFSQLGWNVANCFNEFDEKGISFLGRDNKSDVVLISKLRPVLQKINPGIPEQAIDEAIKILTQDRSLMGLVSANREVYDILKNGVLISYLNKKNEQATERIKIIDWNNIDNNDFFLASQFWMSGDMYTRRADLVGFVNGIPLLFIELKASHRNLKQAYDKNLRDYKSTIPQVFWFNGVIILSNGSISRVGTISAELDHFSEWKRINSEGEKGIVSLETTIRGICEKERFLDIIENYTVFREEKNGPIKIVAKNHQYLGVEKAIKAFALTLTPTLSQRERENSKLNYHGGFYFAGLIQKARELRQKPTSAEQIAWEVLRDRQFMNLKFRRQHQIGEYIADFYCHEKNLVIEIDGPIHSEKDVHKKDEKRDAYFRSLGIHVIRFSNEVILHNTEKFLNDLQSAIASASSPSGRGIQGEGASVGRIGVFWHTQGAGKTEAMIFFSQKILRKIPGNWTFVIVTDRKELDEQTYKRFVRSGLIKGKQEWAQNTEDLRRLLRENHRYIFTTIQKFRTEKGEVHPVVSSRSDIIVMTDEAHRTQYDIFAMNMRRALPNAGFIGFTGTPLIVGEEKTKEVFGDYVSIYNFRQAVEDRATVPLFYENRKPKVQLVNLSLNEDIQRILEEAELDEAEQHKFEREFSKEYQLITREERLEDIAQDIVVHFMNRGFMGKAMVVSIDKATAVKMYDKVKKYWDKYVEKLQKEYGQAIDDKVKEEIGNKLIYMRQTDMAVVVSPSQNEVEDLKAKGVDISPHRRRMNTEDLDEKFKDPDDPLRIVFLCAMWMTGFDVPVCSTIYLDKPMKNHTLMQTIARVNRVFGEQKIAGLIVDYIGVLHNLNKALSIYAAPTDEGKIDMPIIEKSELIEQLRKDIQEITELFEEWGVSLSKIITATGFERINLMDDAIEHILGNDERQAQFREKNAIIQKTYKAILPDTAASEFQPIVKLLQVLAEKLSSISPTVDISDVLQKVSELLDKSVKVEPKHVAEKPGEEEEYKKGRIIDLSKVDFEKLQEKFKKGCKRILAERLRKAIEVRLEALLMLNKSRINYLEKFQQLIDEYNAGSMNVEEYYRRLIDFVKNLDEEEKRALSENLTEEELAIYDLLVNPPLKMTQKDIMAVKKVAHDLLEKLKLEKLVLDWRKKQQARASVRLCIEEILENLPPIFTAEIYRQKCGLVYQHVYESYYGSGASVYAHQN